MSGLAAVYAVLRRRRPPAAHRAAWDTRAALVRATILGDDAPTFAADSTTGAFPEALRGVVDPTDHSHVWLTLAVLSGRLPGRTTVVEVAREAEFAGADALWRAVARETTDESAAWTVRVAVDQVLVDLAHTASTILTTGIQRVARETARRWLRDHDVTLISWTRDFQGIRELTATELERIASARAAEDVEDRPEATVLVPWHSTYIVPELAAEPNRSARLHALAEVSPNRSGVIGFDCVPITSAETTQTGFAAIFAANLAAVRSFDRVATISVAAETEYTGWRMSLAAIGVEGPDIRAIPLPVEAAEVDDADMISARADFVIGDLPLVLVVGSHEPRKNHLAVLHAAELLWREGHAFSLSFAGGNAWGSDAFFQRVAELQEQGRPVGSESRVSDERLWAAYRLARCTVFPSLHEGFGLPVAESLAVGTPAITSRFGSMAEIAEEGGALMVDPHDDHSLADAMRALVTDDALRARLADAARRRPGRTWDMYAAELWDYLVNPN